MESAEIVYGQLNTVDDIQRLIGKEENLTLEVKRSSNQMDADDKANLAIALSGFANSAGGVLIFGLVAAKGESDADTITRTEPIKSVGGFLSEVQSLIGQAVVPIVDGVQAKAITYKQDPSLGFVVVFVPESSRAPHRAMLKGTKQYYKRAGDSFYVMEHFDLADMFGKRQRPDLCFGWRLSHISFSSDKPYKFSITLGLKNVGRGLARFPSFGIKNLSGASLSEYGVDGNRNHGLPMLRSDRWPDVTFGGGVDNVVHPGTIMSVTALGKFDVNSMSDVRFNLEIAAEDLEASTQQIEINSQTIKKRLADPVKRAEWVFE